jgi:sec-independent protein translocase protein TatA
MFGTIGMPELVIISVIALIVFGPAKLPDFGRSLGEAIRGFKKAINDTDQTAVESSQTPTPPTNPSSKT